MAHTSTGATHARNSGRITRRCGATGASRGAHTHTHPCTHMHTHAHTRRKRTEQRHGGTNPHVHDIAGSGLVGHVGIPGCLWRPVGEAKEGEAAGREAKRVKVLMHCRGDDSEVVGRVPLCKSQRPQVTRTTTTKTKQTHGSAHALRRHMRTDRERHLTQPYNHALIRRQHHTHARAHAPPVTQLTWYDDGSWLGQKLMMPKMGLSFWSS